MSGMATPTIPISVESLSFLAPKDASERIRMMIKKRMTLSKRRGTWFRLNVQERTILNLALSLKVSFKSLGLLRAVVSVMKRLHEVSDKSFTQMLRGAKIACSFSDAAVSWGYAAAENWRSDKDYISFLGRLFGSQAS